MIKIFRQWRGKDDMLHPMPTLGEVPSLNVFASKIESDAVVPFPLSENPALGVLNHIVIAELAKIMVLGIESNEPCFGVARTPHKAKCDIMDKFFQKRLRHRQQAHAIRVDPE